MIEKIGTCQYCGQNVMVRVPDDATRDECNKEAAKICNCLDAQQMQAIEQSIALAEKVIKEEYASNQYAQKVLMAAVNAVGYGSLDKVTITAGCTRYVMSKSKGAIKTEKITTSKEVRES